MLIRVGARLLCMLALFIAPACGGQTTGDSGGTGANGSGAVGGQVASGGATGGATAGGSGGGTAGGSGGATAGGAGGTSGTGATGGGGGPGVCSAWGATSSYVDFMLVLSLALKPGSPLVFYASVSVAQAGPETTMSMIFQPLAWYDRKTPVGDTVKLGIPLSPDGKFDVALPPIDVPGDANPITKGGAIAIDISSFSGSFCADGTAWCGTLDGSITKPIALKLAGSTWTLSSAPFPEPPPIDCNGDLATPVGQL